MRTAIDVILGFHANTRALEAATAAVNRVRAGFDEVVGSVGRFAAGALSIGAVTGVVRRVAGEAFNLAERFGDVSDRLKIGFEDVQVLDHVARRFGQNVENFSEGFDSLQKKLAEASSGNLKAIDSFHRLGLTITELESLTPERQLEALARGMVNATDEADAFLAVSEILGTSAAPKLQAALELLGTQGFDRLAQSARDSGQIISESTGKALADAKQQIEDFGRTVVAYWSERIGALARKANELAAGSGLSPAEAQRSVVTESISRIQSEARGVRSESERVALLERLRNEMAQMEQLRQIDDFSDLDRRTPLSETDRAAREMRQRQMQATSSAITFLEREGPQQIERNTAADAGEAAADAANRRADAERMANTWLEKNRAQIEAQARAYEESLLADSERLRVIRERIDLIDQESAAAIQAANSEAEAEQIRLQALEDRLPLLREAQAIAEKIAREDERAAEAAARKAASAKRSLGRSESGGDENIALQQQLETTQALKRGIDGVSHAFAEAAVSGKDFGAAMKEVLRQVIVEIVAAIVKALILRAIMAYFGGGGFEKGGYVPTTGAAGLGYADGGYTGPGPRNRVAGVVHGGEYVFSKPEVDRAGLSFFKGVSQSIRGGGYAAGGFVGGMPMKGDAPGGTTINITNNYEAGVSPQQLAELVPQIESRTKAGVLDAMRRREDGF